MKMLRRMVHTARSTSAPALSLSTRHYRTRGVTLIELMIALGFGLVLILATLSIYLANKQTFRQVENLARLNENARIAFELLGRDLREAGATPCGVSDISSTLKNPGSMAWGTTGAKKGITPYGKTQTLPNKAFGTATAERVSGTDAFVVYMGSSDDGITVESQPAGGAANLKLNKLGSGFVDDEIIMACNTNFATIFQITNVNENTVTLVHNTGVGKHNCTKILYKPNVIFDCNSPPTGAGESIEGATIVKVSSFTWYIANNGRSGRSLYRISGATNTTEEMVENVTNMEIEYLVDGAKEAEPFDYVISTNYNTTSGTTPRPKGSTGTSAYSWWPSSFNPIATRVTLTLQTPDAVGTDGQRLSRQVSTVVSLRNQIY